MVAASPLPRSTPVQTEQAEDEHSKFLQFQKAEFFFRLERELEKVNAFYLQKESELKVRLRSLIDKEKVLLSRQGRPGTGSSIHSLQEAFRQFEQDLSKLQKFVETNGTGFRKILKKWDKRSKSTTKELYLARQIDLQPCFSQDAMVELADDAAMHLLGLENLQQSRSLSAPSSPVTGLPSQSYTLESGFSPVQQQMDELETDLFNAVTTAQVSAVQELLDRRVTTPTALSINAKAVEKEARVGIHLNRLELNNAREVITRVFWRCCSEKDAPDAAIQLLVQTGLVDFKFIDDISDRTCLHEAAMVGRLDLLKLCVEHGINSECSDVYGRRPLHYVSMYGYSDCADYLLSLKVSMTATDHDGFRPLIYSIMNGHSRCVELFLNSGVEIEASREGDPIPLGLACQFGHEDIAMMLIGRGANVRACNADGLEPLHITCREGHVRLTKTLTTGGAQLDQEDKYMCWTPLFYSASEGHVECVKILLEAGCDVNVVDEHKKTPIYYAASEGHADCVELMVNAGGKVEGTSDGLGRPEDSVMSTPAPLSTSGMMATATWPETVSELESQPLGPTADNDDQDVDMDMIPSLSLPPPIIPFRIYGHNYLDKRYQINLTLGHGTADAASSRHVPVRLYGTAQISSLKLVISSRPDTGMIPHNVILPLGESRKVYGFQVDSLKQFTIEFDIFPTYGSKPIGRAVALPSMFSSKELSVGKGILPLLDSHLKVVGELAFEFSVVRPFQGVRLEVGGRLETYWKSTNTIDAINAASTSAAPTGEDAAIQPVSTSTSKGILPHPTSSTQPTLSGNMIPSFITASSLSGEYIQLSIQMTRDYVPVVFSDWLLPVPGFDLSISDVSFEQFKRYEAVLHQRTTADDLDKASAHERASWTSGLWRRKIYERWMSLDQALKILPKNVGVNVELKYPTVSEKKHHRLTSTIEFNKFVDTILETVYDSSSTTHHRRFMFSSFNPVICSAVNWKQPNYAVFFSTHGGYNKIRVTGTAQSNVRVGSKRKESVVNLDSFPSPKHGPVTGIFSSLTSTTAGDSAVHGPHQPPADTTQSSPMSVTSSPPISRSSAYIANLSTGASDETLTWFNEEDRRCTSIKEAIKFARSNNMLGVICEATPLIQVPGLITNIKESGLILTSFGPSNRDAALVHRQKKHGVDAFMVLDSSHSNCSNIVDTSGKKGLMATTAATGLGLDFGIAHGHGFHTEFGAPSEQTAIVVSDLEEGVFRYQNGIDS
ncbi:CDK inhibitor PHO81 [Entomortierella parvispora]|uniref:CDK inhibitor PHO81 n=1 Tax=Entomortierella parvispora TaxID=205924 RepID=A0A9P3H3E8_9FUNG|nr:CDK inhibitor PHO81 [Entomortierella parvispora]